MGTCPQSSGLCLASMCHVAPMYPATSFVEQVCQHTGSEWETDYGVRWDSETDVLHVTYNFDI